MERIEEPELMDEAAQAEAYAQADFAAVNQGFVDAFVRAFPELDHGRIVDLGCGPADIPIRLARRLPKIHVTGVDGAAAMLALGRARLIEEELSDRVELVQGVLPGATDGPFDAVVSNSLLHHLHQPAGLWEEIRRVARDGAPIFVMDLMRPASEEQARSIVETYAGDEPELLKRDFFNSLRAAFTLEEVRAQLVAAGLGNLTVEATSDRHLTVAGRR